jgi:hypothetical protein
MTPVVKLLRLMDGEKPAMGKVYDRMFMIGQKIEERSYSWKEKAAKIHADRWEHLHSEMHSAGYALDPEFMQHASDMDEATQNGIISIRVEKFSLLEEKIEAEKLSSAAANALTSESDKVQDRIAKTMGQLAKYQANDGMFTKPYVIANAKSMAPAVWWATYGKHLPHLAAVARRVLAQPVCASAAERNWSIYGAIKTAARGQMGHAVADKRVYCHEALHLKGKLQTAGYKQVVEKWDTDSDSDESDDEDLVQ